MLAGRRRLRLGKQCTNNKINTMKKTVCYLLLLCFLTMCGEKIVAQHTTAKIRTIITSDGEIDDQDSFIRMLLYANEFNIVGLVYSSSQWHYKGDDKGTRFISEMKNTAALYGEKTSLRWPGTDWMEGLIDKYAAVYPNLLLHSKNYPAPDGLKSKIRVGNIDFEGEMAKDTKGSDFIKQILLDKDESPVFLQIWGGTNTVARALKSIEDNYKGQFGWDSIYQLVSAKAMLYAVLDQDATYKNYVAIHWPNIKIMYNAHQFWCFAYPWPQLVDTQLQTTLRGKWFGEHIKQNHGPLLSAYFVWGDGQKLVGDSEHVQGDTAIARKFKYGVNDFISEGDSPAFLYLIDVGLRNMEDASYGGWGGRMVKSKENPNRWEDGKTVTDFNPYKQKADEAYPQTRWIQELQYDFAVRADWCVKDFAHANHAPVVHLVHSNSLKAKNGAIIQLNGTAIDPDNNSISYRWWQYAEAGSYDGKINIQHPNEKKAAFTIPKDAKPGQTIHVILECKDNGVPSLTRYQRVVVQIQ
jgi:hypothetical protein